MAHNGKGIARNGNNHRWTLRKFSESEDSQTTSNLFEIDALEMKLFRRNVGCEQYFNLALTNLLFRLWDDQNFVAKIAALMAFSVAPQQKQFSSPEDSIA